jgi:hypothetical protein
MSIEPQPLRGVFSQSKKQRGIEMADVYTMNGEEITMGLQGSAVSDEAIRAAKNIARVRGETVRLEDDGELLDVHPDGSVTDGDAW